MKAFEDGQRVRYVGVQDLYSPLKGRVGVVVGSYRDYDGVRIDVKLEGEDKSTSFDPEDFEAFKETYYIENSAEDAMTAEIDLTDPEVTLIKRVIEELDKGRGHGSLFPTLSIERKP